MTSRGVYDLVEGSIGAPVRLESFLLWVASGPSSTCTPCESRRTDTWGRDRVRTVSFVGQEAPTSDASRGSRTEERPGRRHGAWQDGRLLSRTTTRGPAAVVYWEGPFGGVTRGTHSLGHPSLRSPTRGERQRDRRRQTHRKRHRSRDRDRRDIRQGNRERGTDREYRDRIQR